MSLATQDSVWTWPVPVEAYDRAEELTLAEPEFLTVEVPVRIEGGQGESQSFSAVRRLVQPLEDVFNYIEFRGYKKDSLLVFLLDEMGRRRRSFWGWKDEEWIEIVEHRRYDAYRLIAVAYLLGGFQDLEGFGKRRQVYFPSGAMCVYAGAVWRHGRRGQGGLGGTWLSKANVAQSTTDVSQVAPFDSIWSPARFDRGSPKKISTDDAQRRTRTLRGCPLALAGFEADY